MVAAWFLWGSSELEEVTAGLPCASTPAVPASQLHFSCISAAVQQHLAVSLLLSSGWDEAILCRFIHYKTPSTPPPNLVLSQSMTRR